MSNQEHVDIEEYLREVMEKHAKGYRLTPDGSEVPDPIPVAPPVSLRTGPSMTEHIRNLVRSELLRREAEAMGAESFEEADDFDVGDDFDPSSPYEAEFDPPATPEQLAAASAAVGRPVGPSPEPPAAPSPSPSAPSPEPSGGS